jgi:hypothetical protein
MKKAHYTQYEIGNKSITKDDFRSELKSWDNLYQLTNKPQSPVNISHFHAESDPSVIFFAYCLHI